MTQANPTPGTAGALLSDRDIPALLSVPRYACRWELWRAKSKMVEENALHERRLVDELHAPIVEWICQHQFFHPTMLSYPDPDVAHGALPLTGTADLYFADANRYGPGPGVAIVAVLNAGEWNMYWRGDQRQPVVPPGPTVRLQTLIDVYGVRWGAVIPVVGYHPPHAPIIQEASTKFAGELAAEVEKFETEVRTATPPEPDGRAGDRMLKALAELAPPPQIAEVPELTKSDFEIIRRERSAISEGEKRLERALAEVEAAREPLLKRRATIAQTLAPYGPAAKYGSYQISIRTRQRPVSRPAQHDYELRDDDSAGAGPAAG